MTQAQKGFVLLMLLIIAPFIIYGQEHAYLTSTADKACEFYLVKNKIKRIEANSDYREIWIHAVPGDGKTAEFRQKKIETLAEFGLPTKPYSKYSRSTERWIIDLKNDRYSLMQYVSYTEDGDVIESLEFDTYKWNNVIPGSISETIFNVVKRRVDAANFKEKVKNGEIKRIGPPQSNKI